MSTDYTALDVALVKRIEEGGAFACSLEHTPSVRAAALKHATRTKPVFRVIDSRLQALRKRGSIRFAGHKIGWQIVSTEAAHG